MFETGTDGLLHNAVLNIRKFQRRRPQDLILGEAHLGGRRRRVETSGRMIGVCFEEGWDLGN